MTENEAIEVLKDFGKQVSVKADGAYQSTIGEKACNVAIKALKEIQKYRKIEKDLKENYHANVDIPLLMKHFIETVFKGEKHDGFCILTNEDKEEWEEYRTIGTPEELKAAMKYVYLAKKNGTVGQVIENCVKYEEIGTPEECRAAMEKQTETLTVDKAKTIAAKAICIGCGYLTDCKCDYNGSNCMVSKPMLESVLKSFDDWNRRANDGKID